MRSLITAADVKSMAGEGEKTIYVDTGTIITPAARDAADELDISIVDKTERPQQNRVEAPSGGIDPGQGIDPLLIARIVKEVMASLSGTTFAGMMKEADPCGLLLVKGKTIAFEKFIGGKTNENIGVKEIFTRKESPLLSAGFMTLEKTNFTREQKCEEITCILEGSLDITVNQTTYRGAAGDVFYLPKGRDITFSSEDKVKYFFVAYPV